MTEIVQGGIYRRRSDGARLIACKQLSENAWHFYNTNSNYPGMYVAHNRPDEVEPWREPLKKTVTGYAHLWPDGGYRFDIVAVKKDQSYGRSDREFIACKRFEVEITENEFDD